MGKHRASHAHRAGGAARWPAPAVPQRLAGALALIASEAPLLPELALARVTTATQPEAHTLSVLPTVPGLGPLLRLGLLEALQAMARFPRGQDGGSSGRVGTGAQESAGPRSGTAGATSGQADLTWAFSAAAVLVRRHHPAGHTSLAR